MTLIHMPAASVQLTPGVFDARRRKNRDYLDSLTVANLLQNHRIEAGIGDQGWHLHPSRASAADRGLDRHWGWETPGSLLRGHFLGHWMSGAAREVAVTGDAALRAKLDAVLDGLDRCQTEGDGGWVFATPSSFLRRLAEGREVWAPQYAIHKTLMGLVDVHRDLGDERALRSLTAHRAPSSVGRGSSTPTRSRRSSRWRPAACSRYGRISRRRPAIRCTSSCSSGTTTGRSSTVCSRDATF